jgi:hypothetical protein
MLAIGAIASAPATTRAETVITAAKAARRPTTARASGAMPCGSLAGRAVARSARSGSDGPPARGETRFIMSTFTTAREWFCSGAGNRSAGWAGPQEQERRKTATPNTADLFVGEEGVDIDGENYQFL